MWFIGETNMMSLELIKKENEKAMKEAEAHNKQPYVAKYNEDSGVKQAPYIGDYEPEGWIKTEEFFVDSSGFGATYERALTFGQFLAKVKQGRGYAISEAGEFQVYIQEFVRY